MQRLEEKILDMEAEKKIMHQQTISTPVRTNLGHPPTAPVKVESFSATLKYVDLPFNQAIRC
jgi:hypothetical protein